jgi:hypothetical protein
LITRLWYGTLFLAIAVLPALLLLWWRPVMGLSIVGSALLIVSQAAYIAALFAGRLYARPVWALVFAVVFIGAVIGGITVGHMLGPPEWHARRFTARFLPGGVALTWMLLWLKPATDELSEVIHQLRARAARQGGRP